MAIKRRHVKAVIQLRRATEQEWINHDPVLRLGEPAYSTDVHKLKVGNGQTKWSLLPYLFSGDAGEATDYLTLSNLPSINTVRLRGNLMPSELGIKTSDLINDLNFVSGDYYHPGNGITFNEGEIALDDLILYCGTSTINI